MEIGQPVGASDKIVTASISSSLVGMSRRYDGEFSTWSLLKKGMDHLRSRNHIFSWLYCIHSDKINIRSLFKQLDKYYHKTHIYYCTNYIIKIWKHDPQHLQRTMSSKSSLHRFIPYWGRYRIPSKTVTNHQGIAFPSHWKNPPLCASPRLGRSLTMLEVLASTSIGACGPPRSVLTHPGCKHMTKMPKTFKSTLMVREAMFKAA